MIYNMNTKALCLLLGLTAIYGAVENRDNSPAKEVLAQQKNKPVHPILIAKDTGMPLGGNASRIQDAAFRSNAKEEPKFVISNFCMGAGAITTALSAGIVLDSFREAVNDVKYEHGEKASFDSMCWIVLGLALCGAISLSIALFSGSGANVGKVFGIICLFGAVASVTTAMAYMDNMAQGTNPLESTSAILLYITGGLVLLALLFAAGRRYGINKLFQHHGPVAVLGHGVGASLFVAGAGLFMWNMREKLGDVHEYHAGNENVDFNGSGTGFMLMAVCIGGGFLWFCYLTFLRGENKHDWLYKGIGSACVIGSGVMTILAIDALGEVTQKAATSGAADMSLNDLVKQTTTNDAGLFIVIAAGLFVFALVFRLLMMASFCQKKVAVVGELMEA